MMDYIVHCIVKKRATKYIKESYPDDVLTAAADVDKKNSVIK